MVEHGTRIEEAMIKWRLDFSDNPNCVYVHGWVISRAELKPYPPQSLHRILPRVLHQRMLLLLPTPGQDCRITILRRHSKSATIPYAKSSHTRERAWQCSHSRAWSKPSGRTGTQSPILLQFMAGGMCQVFPAHLVVVHYDTFGGPLGSEGAQRRGTLRPTSDKGGRGRSWSGGPNGD